MPRAPYGPTWWMLTVPQQHPAMSTTGNVVVRCWCIFRRASDKESSVAQHADAGCMISSTRTSDARRSSAATLQHTSRSVTTPTTFRAAVSSTTGEHPHRESRIARAACAAVSLGVQHDDAAIGSITSPQQPMAIPPRWRTRAICVSRARPSGGTARCRSARIRDRRRRRRGSSRSHQARIPRTSAT